MNLEYSYVVDNRIITKTIRCRDASLNTSTDTLMIDYEDGTQEHIDRDKIFSVRFGKR